MAFILALAKYGEVTPACEAVGVGRRTVYDLRTANPVFRRQWDEAMAQYERDLIACVEVAPRRLTYG